MELERDEAQRTSIFRTISDLLEWLAKIWAPLGAFLIGTAAIYWLEFIRVYAIPVSFASSSVLTGLPAIAAAIAAMVGVLTTFILMPAALLWVPVDSAGKTLMDGHQNWQTLHPSMPSGISRPRNWGLLERWIAAQIVLGLLWAVIITTGILAKGASIGLITMAATLAATAGYWYWLRPIRLQACGEPSLDFQMMFCALTGTQFLVALGVIYVAIQTAPDSSTWTLGLRALFCLAALTVLSFAQLMVAKLVSKGWYPNAPKHIVLALMVITALPLALPTVGASMTAFALRTSSSDGKFCVILLTSDTATPKTWHEVLNSKMPDQSVPLDFAVRLEDTYYVKQTKAAPTYPIPVSQTRGIASCPNNQHRS